jgi:GR25 family glycosyltransferase involved in LPS biosynthesis
LIIFKGYNDFGLLGYVRSHAFALKTAIKNNWNNILIIDDNAIWNNYDESYKVLEKIVKDNPNYDVITLGNKNADLDPNTFKLKSGDSISGYLVNGKYLKKLYDIFNYSEDSLRSSSLNLIKNSKLRNEKRKELETEYSPDNLWKKLQKEDNWFIVNPALMVKEN